MRAAGPGPKVALLCGGGSGHEPVFGGFVGKGMLTGAVAGSVFASPPPAAVLAALEAAQSPGSPLPPPSPPPLPLAFRLLQPARSSSSSTTRGTASTSALPWSELVSGVGVL